MGHGPSQEWHRWWRSTPFLTYVSVDNAGNILPLTPIYFVMLEELGQWNEVTYLDGEPPGPWIGVEGLTPPPYDGILTGISVTPP